MSGPYYDWYITNTIVLLSLDHGLLDPRRRGNVLPTPLRTVPIADVNIPPPSHRRWVLVAWVKVKLVCINNRMKFVSQFHHQLMLLSTNHPIILELLHLNRVDAQWLQGWTSFGIYLNINLMYLWNEVSRVDQDRFSRSLEINPTSIIFFDKPQHSTFNYARVRRFIL